MPNFINHSTFKDLVSALNMHKYYYLDHITLAEEYEVEYKLWRGRWDPDEKDSPNVTLPYFKKAVQKIIQ